MEKNIKVQVKANHYDFNKYVGLGRRNSYYHQIEQVCKYSKNGGEILLIGVGDKIVGDILIKLGYNVTTFDYDKELNPDIIGDVTKINEIITKKYDTIICCQVLEHIPFEYFEQTIESLSKIGENLILSLPNNDIWIKNWLYVPLLKDIIWKLHFRIFWHNHRNINKEGFGEHYWEINAKPEWKKKNIEHILKKYFYIEDCFVPFNNTYHIFRALIKGKKDFNK